MQTYAAAWAASVSLLAPVAGIAHGTAASAVHGTPAASLAGALPDRAPATPWRVRRLGTLEGRGLVTSSVVWTDPASHAERIIQIYEYNGLGYDVVTVDPNSGTFATLANPSPDSSGVMTVGKDGHVYIGTEPNGTILRFDPKTQAVTSLGRVGKESYVLAMTTASDGTIYGGTYPSAQLFSVDAGTGRIRLLGHIGPADEEYAQTLQVSDDNRFVYVGVGAAHANVVSYELSTGKQSTIAGGQASGFGKVFRGADDAIYASTPQGNVRIEHGTARPAQSVPAPAVPRLHDGRGVETTNTGIALVSGARKEPIALSYRGRPISAFRLVKPSSSALYASSILPAYLYKVDASNGAIEQLGYMGAGEVYSFETRGAMLYMGAYAGAAGAPLFAYDMSQPFNPPHNPRFIHYPGENHFWRPVASASAADGSIYFGSQPAYGELGGHLVAIDPATLRATDLGVPISSQSISSLAPYRSSLVGATGVGNIGVRHATGQASLFFWDPSARKVTFQTTPVHNAATITDLVVAGDLLVGIADHTVFGFDLVKRTVRFTAPFAAGNAIANSAAYRPDGFVYGASDSGIFRIDPANGGVVLVAPSPQPLTAGFASDAEGIFAAAGATIYRFDS
jgi:outer membrane protein assembly factor BamB